MITPEEIQRLAMMHQTPAFPNVVREYVQHLFLSHLYSLEQSEKILFKGGTALRMVYGSPRFSEDLDFAIVEVPLHEQKVFIEDKFADVLSHIQSVGIQTELGAKPDTTKEGYYGEASFILHDFPPVVVSINVSSRDGRLLRGAIESIPNDFVPTYNLYLLEQSLLIDEKIVALLSRQKPRDFYDVYYLMRKNLLTVEQRERLKTVTDILQKSAIDFRQELEAFLPQNQHAIIRDFRTTFVNELKRQLA